VQITVRLPSEGIAKGVSEGFIGALSNDSREPYQVISDAIRDGVAMAISEKLSRNLSGELVDEIARCVAEAMTRR
jgi:hypothetical protein